MSELPDPLELQRRLIRERKARHEAEVIAEKVTSDLYIALNEVKRVNQELETLNQALRDFVAMASHDLRGPLTAILGFMSTLRKNWSGVSDEQKLEFVTISEHQANLLAQLIDDLLTISRIESGGIQTHKKAVEVSVAVKEAMDNFLQQSSQIAVAVPVSLMVLADPIHLQRILTNFIENALKYGQPPIKLQAMPRNETVEIRISDSGDGIPGELLPRLFQKFARAENADSKGKGTGLGLSIVKGLAEANDGAVWYEPNRPKGSCFVLRLPGRRDG